MYLQFKHLTLRWYLQSKHPTDYCGLELVEVVRAHCTPLTLVQNLYSTLAIRRPSHQPQLCKIKEENAQIRPSVTYVCTLYTETSDDADQQRDKEYGQQQALHVFYASHRI